MAGGGSDTKGGSGQTSGSKELEAFTGELRRQSGPVREETFKQILEGLTTGGIDARIPMVQQAVEGSQAATSNAMRQLDENMAISGIGRTGFGARARADTLMSGEQRTAQLPFELIQQFINTALGQATGTPTTIVQGLGGAASSQASLAGSRAQSEAAIMSSLLQGMMSGASNAAMLGAL